jgi:membrane-bound lytic murein transglycosylase D
LTESSFLPSDLVPKLVAAVLIETRPRKYRFEIDYELPLTYDEIEVGGNRKLASVAEITGVEAQTLKELNPESTDAERHVSLHEV